MWRYRAIRWWYWRGSVVLVSLHWLLIRFMRKDSEGIWSRCLPMRDSSLGRWRSQTWRVFQDFPLLFPLIRSLPTAIRVQRWEQWQRFMIIIDCYMPESVRPIVRNAARRLKNKRLIRWWMLLWHYLRGRRSSCWHRLSGAEKASMWRFLIRQGRVGMCVWWWMAISMNCRKRLSLRRIRSTIFPLL